MKVSKQPSAQLATVFKRMELLSRTPAQPYQATKKGNYIVIARRESVPSGKKEK